eukprot:TRINITY_DN18469_c0_g1_i1.p1 TRINITY_DN18469_c0_g1~~TRINITY_DN18469_c0_g1_i1.p1  ORF type:complete len:284 (+),score=100.94 TRINITY_DN18469_c0_g1_i1:42-893(+)
MSLDEGYKLRSEARLQGREGASFASVAAAGALVVSVPLLLQAAMLAVGGGTRGRWRAAAETALLVPIVVAGVSAPGAPECLLAAAAVVVAPQLPHVSEAAAPTDSRGRLESVTQYRAMLMLLTVLCILAVDFPPFPPQHMKTESWGVSLMDIGAASAVFAQGLVTAPRGTAQSASAWARTSLPLLLLGVGRVLLIKGTNYQEHLTEYGVHWNFFFTLALMPVLLLPCRVAADRLRVPLAAQAVCIAGSHQRRRRCPGRRRQLCGSSAAGLSTCCRRSGWGWWP